MIAKIALVVAILMLLVSMIRPFRLWAHRQYYLWRASRTHNAIDRLRYNVIAENPSMRKYLKHVGA